MTTPTRLAVSGATLSDDRVYRYALWREWDCRPVTNANLRSFVVIGLNPSTADEQRDDPTIRRCVAFAKREGCGRLYMLNLFAFRATDPAAMKAASDPVGPDNDRTLAHFCRPSIDDPVVVAAWGVHGDHRGRGRHVIDLLRRAGVALYCLGTTKDGHPRHPLYIPGGVPLLPFSAALATVEGDGRGPRDGA